MAEYIAPIQRLIEEFRRLPGVGAKTAARYAFAVLNLNDDELARFGEALVGIKRDVHKCPICFSLSEDPEMCGICRNESRDKSVICVVENAKDVMVMEKVRGYRGVYHVLHGAISPVSGVTPDKIRLAELLGRLRDDGVKEIIVATDPDVEGEATAMYISRLIKPLGIRVSRLAYGIPVGSDLEYADEITLSRAIDGRKDY